MLVTLAMLATLATLGVGEATRDGQSCLTRRPLGAGPCLRLLTLGACIESQTEVGGVCVPLISTLAVGVVERLGYIVLARESGRGGEETVAVFIAREALACSWAKRASSVAT
jgi:hypothetical protein